MKLIWKELSFFIKAHKVRYIAIFISMMISSITLLIPARVIGQLVDEIVNNELTIERLIQQVVIFLGALLISFFTEAWWTYYIFSGSYQIQSLFRVRILKNLLTKRMPFYAHFRTGDLVTRASEDVRTLGIMMGYGVYGPMNAVLSLTTVILTMVTTISWKLSLLSLVPLPILAYLFYKVGVKMDAKFTQAQEALSQMNNEVLEIVDGTYVIRAYGQEERMNQVFRQKTEDALQKNITVAKWESIFVPMCTFTMYVCVSIGLLYGAYLASKGEILMGDIVAYQVYIGMIIWPVVMIGDCVIVVQEAKASLKRILEVFHTSDEMEPRGETVLTDFETITFQQFSFTYPGETDAALKDVTMTIQKGQTIGIVGKTGSGKTTFLKQFLHQYPYQGQQILVNQQPLVSWTDDSWRELIAYVPQEHTLFSRTIRENLQVANPKSTEGDIWNVLEQAAMAEEIRRMPEQLETVVGEKGVTLSGGQKQRLSIARAFLRDTEILLLDDALSAVDANTEQTIIQHIKRKRHGRTTIITSHRFSAVRHADTILVFDNGRVVDCGTHEELLAHKGWYYEQYLKQEIEEVELNGDD